MARSAILIFVIAWPERCQDCAKCNPDIRNRNGKMLVDEMNFLEAKRNPDIRNHSRKMLADETSFIKLKHNPESAIAVKTPGRD